MKKSEEIKKLAVYWGKESLFFAEISSLGLKKFFEVNLPQNSPEEAEVSGQTFDTDQLATLIKNALRHQDVNLDLINLSLPTTEVLFRSFIIPWMQPEQIKGAVDFEVTKYIPFSLEELSYSYHPITVEQSGNKYIRIIFAAIKKSTLDNYLEVFDQIGMEVDIVEPSSQSLIRSLNQKSLITDKKTVTVIEIGATSGRILVVDQGAPQFVREFPVTPKSIEDTAMDPEMIATRLINEIRISLDYFNRQDTHLVVQETLLLTMPSFQNLKTSLEADLGLPTKFINGQMILESETIEQIDYLNAAGAALVGFITTTTNFNLSTRIVGLRLQNLAVDQESNTFPVILTYATICLSIIGGVFYYTHNFFQEPQQKLQKLTSQLGAFADAPADSIQKKNTELTNKLQALKNIRLHGNSASFLTLIPTLLPEGIWIRTLDINYQDSINPKIINTGAPNNSPDANKTSEIQFSPRIKIIGYSYLENEKDQFSQINLLLKNLKNNSKMAAFFPDIDLINFKMDRLNDLNATYFEIVCQ